VKVVDGDTLHVSRHGAVEKLRLLSVDTEEKLTGRSFDPAKPETVFGQETMLWAQELFAARAGEDGVTRVGLRFPGGVEARDVYGRLLCHVLLDDGTDFNVQLVREGKSPYFNKYGNSLLCHEAFVAAQAEARAAGRGIWDPRTNAPTTPGAPAAKRDYSRLLPWWQCRAEAVDAYRAARREDPERVAAADAPDQLAACAERCAEGGVVRVFGVVDRTFDEEDGTLTLLFRTGRDLPAFRARLSPELQRELAALELRASMEPYRQNYLWVTGSLVDSERGFEIRVGAADAIEPAGPEPVFEPLAPEEQDSGAAGERQQDAE
jgi:endonuclease YncB( thermonuclease family)